MSEMDVIELSSANVILPNMTIQVEGKDNDEKIADFYYDQEVVDEVVDEKQVKVNFVNTVCQYENEKYKKLSDLGLTIEKERELKNNRAKRFKLSFQEEYQIEVDNKKVKILLENISKQNECLEVCDPEYIRTDALYIHGVNSLTTQQVFKLFDKFLPKKIEWINDDSCVVVWNSHDKAANALLQVTVPQPEKDKITEHENQNLNDFDDIDLMDTSTPIEKNDNQLLDNISQTDEDKLEKGSKIAGNIAVNPLLECVESFTIINKTDFKLRFACLKDKKSNGANKRSQFYRKHGNPHYGGVKGILSNSFRRKYQKKRANIELEDLKVETSRIREAKRQRKIGAFKYQRQKTEEQLADEELMNLSASNLEGAMKYNAPVKSNKNNEILPKQSSDESDSEDSFSAGSDDDIVFPYNTMIADKVERLEKISMKKRLYKNKTDEIKDNSSQLTLSSGTCVDLRHWLKNKK